MKNTSNSKNSGLFWLAGLIAAVVAGLAGLPAWGALIGFGLFGLVFVLPIIGEVALGGFIGTIVLTLGQFVHATFFA